MLLLFGLAMALVWPLFVVGYLDKWGSIESSFIAEVRFIKEHFPPPRWQPLYYLGTRFDYVYAMGLRMGPALLARAFGLEPAHAYHLYSAVFYCLGISAAYLFGRALSGSRKVGWFVGLGYALTSPAFLLVKNLRLDAQFWEPIRLGVLVRYGEGPHSSSITFLLFALAFAWRAIRGGRALDLALAALAAALTVWHNFYGATALAILYPLLAWSLCVGSNGRLSWYRAGAIPVAAYGLLAFWLTPSYMRITRHNVQYIADKPNDWSRWVVVALAALFLAVSWRIGRQRPHRALPLFLGGALIFMILEVAGYYYLGFVFFGNPHRHAPELDFVMLLAVGEGLRRLWLRPDRRWLAQAATAVVLLLMLISAQKYVRKSWKLYVAEDHKQRVEYQLQDWVRRNRPDARAHVSGSVRFWYLTWSDRAQVEGAQDPGILNDSFMPAHWEIVMGSDGEITKQWLQALGTDLIIVNGPGSQEIFHDHQHPEKFRGLFPVLFDNGRGDVIYEVPRRYRGLARVVDTKKLEALGPIAGNGTRESLAPYVEVIENGPDAPAQTRWDGFTRLDVKAPVERGQAVLIQESYDPAWRAYGANGPLPVSKTVLGFMRVDPPAGTQEFTLEFETPLENRLGTWLSAATALALLIFAVRGTKNDA
jgi:hypothetical protein